MIKKKTNDFLVTLQLFWEKRLEGLRACDPDGYEFDGMNLPRNLKPVGPYITEETLLQSVATALHVSTQPVTGQTGAKSSLEKNPGVFLNPDQPLVQVSLFFFSNLKLRIMGFLRVCWCVFLLGCFHCGRRHQASGRSRSACTKEIARGAKNVNHTYTHTHC